MSDLHDLSNPTEEAAEEILKKENQVKEVKKNESKEELLKLWIMFKQKYLKKLFFALGIAVTICAILLWGLGQLLSKAPIEEVQVEPTEETPVDQGDTVKFIRFDGHQYYFYVPENYSYLNRTRNEDLNEIVFSQEDGTPAFVLQEFEAENDNEETLDSIYSYISTTVQPTENTVAKIGENTFKRRAYKTCIQPEPEAPEGSICSAKIYHSTFINGLIVIFESTNIYENLEQDILSTFTKNVIDPKNLSSDYIYTKIPSIKNKLQAIYAFGPPLENNATEIIWENGDNFKFELGFGPDKSLTSAKGLYGKNFVVDMQDNIPSASAQQSFAQVMGNFVINDQILRTNPNAIIFMDDHIPNDEYWEITISMPEDEGGILLAEYRINKNTYILEEVSDTN